MVQILKHLGVDDTLFTGSLVLDQPVCRNKGIVDPVIEIFVSVRNKYKNEFLISILPAMKNAAGWEYTFIPANIQDGEECLTEKFQDYLENKIAPEFEEKLELFFSQEDGYAAYQTCVEEGESKAAKKVKDFLYRTGSDDERKRLDKKAKKERKAQEKAAVDKQNREETLKKMGVPARFFALF